MKKAFGFILVAAALLLASGVQAQGLHLKADVPFDFVIGNTAYTAGNYEIEALSAIGNIVTVKGEGGSAQLVTKFHDCTSGQPAEKTVLVFRQVGGSYFLYQIWTAGNGTGKELPAPKREMRLARVETSPEFILAANLVK